jgi:hypothetical protein
MRPSKHKGSGLWRIRIPPRLSDGGKWQSKYFRSAAKAREAIQAIEAEKAEHGKAAVTAEERHWINVARTELGDLSQLRPVLDHWRLTGAGVQVKPAQEAVEDFLAHRLNEKTSIRTRHDISYRCRAFGKAFTDTPIHSIIPGAIEKWLGIYNAGWSRRSMYKALRPMFAYAKRNRWLLANPFDELDAPDTGVDRKEIYEPEQYRALLDATIYGDEEVCFFLVLSGMAFCRTCELVKTSKGDHVVEWRDVLWLDQPPTLHIRPEVAKSTRRKSGGERFPPLHAAVLSWLESYRNRQGPIIPVSISMFRPRLRKVFDMAEVPFKPNALRSSAISYWLAAYQYGVGQVALWSGNSEAACNLYYKKALRKEQGLAWFEMARPESVVSASVEKIWREKKER